MQNTSSANASSYEQKLAQLSSNDPELRQARSFCEENVVTLISSPGLAILFILVCAVLFLLLVGLLKGIIGLYCYPPVGMCGLGALIDLPRPLSYYQEPELMDFPVQYDVIGWPVHPQTMKRTVRAISLRTEFCLNLIFFLTYPMIMIITLVGLCFYPHVYDTEDLDTDYKDARTIMLTDTPSFLLEKHNPYDRKRRTSSLAKAYRESNAEDDDTRYVLQQMQRSEVQLRNSRA